MDVLRIPPAELLRRRVVGAGDLSGTRALRFLGGARRVDDLHRGTRLHASPFFVSGEDVKGPILAALVVILPACATEAGRFGLVAIRKPAFDGTNKALVTKGGKVFGEACTRKLFYWIPLTTHDGVLDAVRDALGEDMRD